MEIVRIVAKNDFIRTGLDAFLEINRYIYEISKPANIKTETMM